MPAQLIGDLRAQARYHEGRSVLGQPHGDDEIQLLITLARFLNDDEHAIFRRIVARPAAGCQQLLSAVALYVRQGRDATVSDELVVQVDFPAVIAREILLRATG
jgi:hypothetical protein